MNRNIRSGWHAAAGCDRICRIGSGALVDRVSALVEKTRAIAATQANAALTLMYWHIGHMIDVEILKENRAGYDQEVVLTLSRQLSWSHFVAIMPVRAPEARAFYIKQAVSGRLSVHVLRVFFGRQGYGRREIANAQTPGGSMIPADTIGSSALLPRKVNK